MICLCGPQPQRSQGSAAPKLGRSKNLEPPWFTLDSLFNYAQQLHGGQSLRVAAVFNLQVVRGAAAARQGCAAAAAAAAAPAAAAGAPPGGQATAAKLQGRTDAGSPRWACSCLHEAVIASHRADGRNHVEGSGREDS